MLSHLNACGSIRDINAGDLLVIQRKSDKRRILVKCAEVIDGKEILISKKKNDYFIWDMYKAGESWVWRVWNLGPIELTNITNNMNEFPR